MTRYFFETIRNGIRAGQADGQVLPDKLAAWDEAIVSSSEIIREMRRDIESELNWQMEVTDESGQVIYRLRFTVEAVA